MSEIDVPLSVAGSVPADPAPGYKFIFLFFKLSGNTISRLQLKNASLLISRFPAAGSAGASVNIVRESSSSQQQGGGGGRGEQDLEDPDDPKDNFKYFLCFPAINDKK